MGELSAAFEEVAGFALDDSFLEGIEEVTARAIVQQALSALSPEERDLKERAVRRGFLRRLKHAHKSNRSSFPAIEGAAILLRELKDRGIPVAIATGDWLDSISFKLRAAGIPIDDIPMVTSSEFYSRADIIAEAVSKAGRPLREAIYVGDGLWDLRACKKLGIPFVGVGRRREELRNAGAAHVLRNLDPMEFFRIVEKIELLP